MTTMTLHDLREKLKATLASSLRARGFLVAERTSPHLDVSHAVVGLLATIDFYDTSTRTDGELVGYVRLNPRGSHSGRGRYRLTASITKDLLCGINMTNLVNRLRSEVPKAEAERKARREADTRNAKDKAIYADLGPMPKVNGLELDVSVFDGLVDINLTDISPEAAKRVLAALATWYAS